VAIAAPISNSAWQSLKRPPAKKPPRHIPPRLVVLCSSRRRVVGGGGTRTPDMRIIMPGAVPRDQLLAPVTRVKPTSEHHRLSGVLSNRSTTLDLQPLEPRARETTQCPAPSPGPLDRTFSATWRLRAQHTPQIDSRSSQARTGGSSKSPSSGCYSAGRAIREKRTRVLEKRGALAACALRVSSERIVTVRV
jgi:hypothetical protein